MTLDAAARRASGRRCFAPRYSSIPEKKARSIERKQRGEGEERRDDGAGDGGEGGDEEHGSRLAEPVLGSEHDADGARAVREPMEHHRDGEDESGLATGVKPFADDDPVDEAVHRESRGRR